MTVLLKALGWSTEEILALFEDAESIKNTLEKDHFESPEEALEVFELCMRRDHIHPSFAALLPRDLATLEATVAMAPDVNTAAEQKAHNIGGSYK